MYEDYFNYIMALGAGFMFLIGVFSLIGVVAHIVYAIFVGNALNKIGYKNWWFVWIPFLRQYAIADIVKGEDGLVDVSGFRFEEKLYKFYWLVPIMIASFNFIIPVGAILGLVINSVCGAICYKKLYSYFETVNESDVLTQIILYTSGLFPIVPLIKCIMLSGKDPIETI